MTDFKFDSKIALKEEIMKSIKELEETRHYFELVDDPDLLDYAIYKEKALLTKISFLIKKAKAQDVKNI